ncbi:MAG: hypothetical protein HKN53_10670 [Maribacter sp.]|nr:hypothetical protein [Bacteroidia bacterium]NND80352.1 hypothetical protein [Maribacter sp.]
MNHLLKLALIVICITMSQTLFAQTFGVKAGLNLSKVFAKDDNETFSDEFDFNPGFHAGVTVNFPISGDDFI